MPPRRVLLIDDEPSIGHLIRCALRNDVVHICLDGQSAISALAEASPDIILCDLLLPDLDGPSVFSWLLQQRPALAGRVVFVSGGATSASHERFLQQTQQPVLTKPFRLQKLLDTIEQVAA